MLKHLGRLSMISMVNVGRRRWINYAACLWALMFAAPHTWWALGFPAGFPGGQARGQANHHLMMTTWRYYFDVGVIFLSLLAFFVALALIQTWGRTIPFWILRTMAWIASGMLTLRGVAGMVVDGTSDPVWWPTFLVGGILFGSVAWLARSTATGIGVTMKSEFPGAVPEIPVKDVDKAAAYYESKLGFSVDWGGEEGGIAGVSKGQCRLFLTNGAFRKQYGNSGPAVIWLNLDSKEEVNELNELWKANQTNIVSPPESKPWGLHEFTIADLDGNLLRVFYDFGTSERAASTS